MSTALLDGLVIVDVTESLDGGFCARLLADMGAHVVRCEPRTADRPAAQDPRRLAEAIHVHRGKTIQQVERVSPDDADVRRLLVSADLLVDDGGPDGFVESADDLAREHPDLVVTTISGFGRMAGWPGAAGRGRAAGPMRRRSRWPEPALPRAAAPPMSRSNPARMNPHAAPAARTC